MFLVLIAIASALAVGPMPPPPPPGWQTAPPRPYDHHTPRALLDATVELACRGRGSEKCQRTRGHLIRERARELHWVGVWYQATWQLDGWISWWLSMHAARESRFFLGAIGDDGNSVGLLQIQASWIGWWYRNANRHLDRLDPAEAARALMHGVAYSYRFKTPKACPNVPAEKLWRLAVARTTRTAFAEVGPKVPRCNFWILDKDGIPRETAGITADLARDAYQRSGL